jgi:hypothetical protein
MNLPRASSEKSVLQVFQAILEFLDGAQVAAWLPEFPDSKVIATDRVTAIIKLKKILKKRLENNEYVVIEVDQEAQIIDTFPSIPSDDRYFRELMAMFRADRELVDDNPAYMVNW